MAGVMTVEAFATESGLPRCQQGFTLLEVMLTVVIISFGLLGLGGLHVQSKQSNLIGVQRSVASQLAHDLFERMRSNPAALASYVPSDSARVLSGAVVSEPSPDCASVATLCDPIQLAAHDLWDWERRLGGALTTEDSNPVGELLSPTACIGRPAGGGSGTYTIAIAWRSTKPVGDPSIGANAVADACGADSGKYDLVSSGDNQMRHVMWMQSYIMAN